MCSGGINTPKLLKLSGIGDQAQLCSHGIKTLVHAPEVGQNFQDHLLHGGCIWEPKEHIPRRNSAANASAFQTSAVADRVRFHGSIRPAESEGRKAASHKRPLMAVP